MLRRPDNGSIMANPTSSDESLQLQQLLNAAASILLSSHPARHRVFQWSFQQVLDFFQAPYLADESLPSEVSSGNSVPVNTVTTAPLSCSTSASFDPSLLAIDNPSSNSQFPFESLPQEAHGSVDKQYASFTQPPANTLLRQPVNRNSYMPTFQEPRRRNFSLASSLAGNSGYLAAHSQVHIEKAPGSTIYPSPDVPRSKTQRGSSVTDGQSLDSMTMTLSGSRDSAPAPNLDNHDASSTTELFEGTTTELFEGTDQRMDELQYRLHRFLGTQNHLPSSIMNANPWSSLQSCGVQRLQKPNGNDSQSFQPSLLDIFIEDGLGRAFQNARSISYPSCPPSISEYSSVLETYAVGPQKRKRRFDEESDLSYPGAGKARRMKHDPQRNLTAAETRRNGACMRCSRRRIMCEPNPLDPKGQCITCMIAATKKVHLGCLRLHITIIILFRKGPIDEFKWTYQLDGTRMTTINALDPNVKYIYLTQGFEGSFLRIPVNRYDPQPNTDVLHYRWRSATKGEQRLKCEPYAIANVDQTTKAINEFLDENIDFYLSGALEGKSQVWRDIFDMARRKYDWARQNNKQDLYYLALRLWAASRFIENPWEIVGLETLGMQASTDPESPYYRKIPVPPAMDNHIDRIVIVNLLERLRNEILKEVHKLHQANKRNFWQDWFKEFVCSAIILNNYALATEDDIRFAKRHDWPNHCSNHKLIEDFLISAKTVLAHFHYTCDGEKPFLRDWSNPSEPAAAHLDEEQRRLMTKVSSWIVENSHNPQQPTRLEDDRFLALQLFKPDWKPHDLNPEGLSCP